MTWVGTLLGVLAGAAFGLSNIVVRPIIRRVGVATTIFWVIALNALLFTLWAVILQPEPVLSSLTLPSAAAFAVAGVVSLALGRSYLYSTIRDIGVVRASAFRVASPGLTVLLGFLVLHELLFGRQYAGIALLLCGLYVLAARPERGSDAAAGTPRQGPGHAERFRRGVITGATATALFAVGDILRKFGLGLVSAPVLASAVGAVTAALVLLGIHAARRTLADVIRPPREMWPALVAAGITTMAATYLLFLALQYLPVSVATPLSGTQVLFTYLLSRRAANVDDPASIPGLVGVFACLAGLILVSG